MQWIENNKAELSSHKWIKIWDWLNFRSIYGLDGCTTNLCTVSLFKNVGSISAAGYSQQVLTSVF